MENRKPQIIKRCDREPTEKRELQKRRARLTLVKMLIEDLTPDDAKRVIRDLERQAA